jgi:multicomponent Na+:H+ antiporter subunit E
MILFILNLVMALLWLFLGGGGSVVSFGVGYVLGFGLLWVFQSVLPDTGYIRRSLALVRFLVAFVREFLISNWIMARAVLFGRKQDLYPNLLTYDVSGLTPFEVLVLSHCITLTPGTTTVGVSEDWSRLTLHAFDARDPAQVRASIDRSLRAPLLAFTR